MVTNHPISHRPETDQTEPVQPQNPTLVLGLRYAGTHKRKHQHDEKDQKISAPNPRLQFRQ